VLGNDTDPDGVPSGLKLVAVDKGNAQLEVARLDNGRVRITAGAVAETYVVTYQVQDPQGLSAFGAIQVQVKPKANTAPVANPDPVSVEAGKSIEIPVLGNDNDAEGGQLKVTAVDLPGRISNNGSTVTYDADLGASGVVTLNYTIADPTGATDTSTIRITVNACTAAVPALSDDLFTTGFERAREMLLFANDQNTAGSFAVSQPPLGSGTVNVVDANTGAVVYSPPAGFNGTASFSYAVVNACGTRASATVRVEVNRPPVANPDEGSGLGRKMVSKNVLVNDSDPDNDPLVLTDARTSAGPVPFTAAGVIEFSPPAPPEGTYVVTYTIQDPGGLKATSTLTLSIGAEVNNAPIALDDGDSVTAGKSVSVDTRLNDNDPDGDAFSISSIGAPTPAGLGAASYDGSVVTFTANADASGNVTIPYTIIDARGAQASANVIITIMPPPNTAPVARPDAYTVAVGSGATTLDVLNNDGDADPGDRIFISDASLSDPAAGTVAWNDTGLVFTLADGYGSDVQISYQISDSKGLTDRTTVSVTVTA
jgi:large repetitive protein